MHLQQPAARIGRGLLVWENGNVVAVRMAPGLLEELIVVGGDHFADGQRREQCLGE